MADQTRKAESVADLQADVHLTVGNARMTVPGFLRRAADYLEGGNAAHGDIEFTRAVDALLGSGIPGVRSLAAETSWLQYDLRLPAGGRFQTLCSCLDQVASRLLCAGPVNDFFFMNKPPGIRIRLRAVPEHRAELDHELRATLNAWRQGNILAHWCPAVYEAEQHLFGGPVSMRSVHRLFTADSIAWLGYHAMDIAPGPGWAMSLLVIRALFDEVGITDWEDRDVWDRLRWQAGRQFSSGLPERWERLRSGMWGLWAKPGRLRSMLAPPALSLVDKFQDAVKQEWPQWRDGYFASGTAQVGLREALAFLIVFHWNRGRLSAARQAAITEALAGSPVPSGPC